MNTLDLIVVDAIVCAILGALISQSKGRSGAEGAIVGAILGLIGLLLIVLAPAKNAGAATPTVAGSTPSANLRPCPRCAEPIQAAAIACRFCGVEVSPIPVSPETIAAPAAPASVASTGLSSMTKILLILVVVALLVLGWMLLKQQNDAALQVIPTFFP